MNVTVESVSKLAAATLFAALGAYFHALMFPIILVVVVMLADYGSGLAAAWVSNEINSRVGILGIIKKLGYALMIVVGFAVDWGVWFAADIAGLDFGHVYIFALLVCMWLIANECISILENLVRMDVKVPVFLQSVVRKLKSAVEKKGEGDDV